MVEVVEGLRLCVGVGIFEGETGGFEGFVGAVGVDGGVGLRACMGEIEGRAAGDF